FRARESRSGMEAVMSVAVTGSAPRSPDRVEEMSLPRIPFRRTYAAAHRLASVTSAGAGLSCLRRCQARSRARRAINVLKRALKILRRIGPVAKAAAFAARLPAWAVR